MTRRRPPRWGAALAAGALALLGLAACAAPAQAHPGLLYAAPAVGSAVPAPPEELVLPFDAPLAPGGTRGDVRGPAGTLAAGPAVISSDGMSVHVPAPLAGPGGYDVAWQATGTDGDLMSGTYQYAVDPAATLAASRQAGSPDWPAAVLRALAFAALAAAAGEAAGTAMMRRAG
ncbi:MAG TPA: copper resistance CopC family protein, partial [Deinococcales bacterium]|nr:copper resistance CopC family protein [Deinococcales bacterium]